MKQKIMPPAYFFILLLSYIALYFMFPVKQIIPEPYSYVGFVLIVFGITINIWADILFKKNQTTVKPHEMPSSFMISGPFHISRHPMYLGMASILFGIAIWLNSVISFVVPILFMTIIDRSFIPVEEKNLEKRFGNRYIDYKKRVRRWI